MGLQKKPQSKKNRLKQKERKGKRTKDYESDSSTDQPIHAMEVELFTYSQDDLNKMVYELNKESFEIVKNSSEKGLTNAQRQRLQYIERRIRRINYKAKKTVQIGPYSSKISETSMPNAANGEDAQPDSTDNKKDNEATESNSQHLSIYEKFQKFADKICMRITDKSVKKYFLDCLKKNILDSRKSAGDENKKEKISEDSNSCTCEIEYLVAQLIDEDFITFSDIYAKTVREFSALGMQSQLNDTANKTKSKTDSGAANLGPVIKLPMNRKNGKNSSRAASDLKVIDKTKCVKAVNDLKNHNTTEVLKPESNLKRTVSAKPRKPKPAAKLSTATTATVTKDAKEATTVLELQTVDKSKKAKPKREKKCLDSKPAIVVNNKPKQSGNDLAKPAKAPKISTVNPKVIKEKLDASSLPKIKIKCEKSELGAQTPACAGIKTDKKILSDLEQPSCSKYATMKIGLKSSALSQTDGKATQKDLTKTGPMNEQDCTSKKRDMHINSNKNLKVKLQVEVPKQKVDLINTPTISYVQGKPKLFTHDEAQGKSKLFSPDDFQDKSKLSTPDYVRGKSKPSALDDALRKSKLSTPDDVQGKSKLSPPDDFHGKSKLSPPDDFQGKSKLSTNHHHAQRKSKLSTPAKSALKSSTPTFHSTALNEIKSFETNAAAGLEKISECKKISDKGHAASQAQGTAPTKNHGNIIKPDFFKKKPKSVTKSTKIQPEDALNFVPYTKDQPKLKIGGKKIYLSKKLTTKHETKKYQS